MAETIEIKEEVLQELGFNKVKNVHNLQLGSLFELWIEKDIAYLTGQSEIFSETNILRLNINNENELINFIKYLKNN